MIRLSDGTRSIRLKLAESELLQLEMAVRFRQVIEFVNNHAFRRRSPVDAFPVVGEGRDQLDSTAQVQQVVPRQLKGWWAIHIRINSKTQSVQIHLHPAGERDSGRHVLDIAVDAQRDSGLAVNDASRLLLFECAKTIIDQFELKSGRPERPQQSRSVMEVGIEQDGREMVVQFDSDDVPAEWLNQLSKTILVANSQIKPGHEKIKEIEQNKRP